MGFRYLWPLALLILIPVIIIMYLLKQKAEPRPFSSLFLWRETYKNLHADAPWEKLKKSLLMVLQILTVIALIIALMAPYVRSKAGNSGHVIIVIDNSASMKTKYDDKFTRLETAISNAVSRVESLSPGTGVSIIVSNSDAVLLLSDSSDRSLAIKRLKSIEPTTHAGSCDAATSMVRSMLVQWESSEVIYYTDSIVTNGFGDAKGYIVDMYSYAENAYVEYAGHGRNEDGTISVLAKITNDTNEPLTCDANLYGDGKIIAVQALNIPAKDSSTVFFENIAFDGSGVCVELNNCRDALEDDNRAYDIVSEIEECNVLLLTEQNLYLEKAIGLINGIKYEKTTETGSGFDAIVKSKKYDLYIFDGLVPDNIPESGNLIFINAYDGNICIEDTKLTGVLINTCDSKVTGYIENFSFGVNRAVSIQCPYWADTFLTAVSGGKTHCLGCIGTMNGRKVCMLGFDFHSSDLPLKLQFPILIYNIMSECAGTGMLENTVINSGNTLQISGKNHTSTLTVTDPDKKTHTLSSAMAAFSETDLPGLYTVSCESEGQTFTETFAVNFPKSECVITARASASSGTADVLESETVATTTFNLRTIIILAALLLLIAEWIIYLLGL